MAISVEPEAGVKLDLAIEESPQTFSFAVMGTVCSVQCSGASPALAAGLGERAAAVVRDLEAKWSRFLPDSEVSAINAHPGDFVTVSPETAAILAAAENWRQATGGLFDIAYSGAGADAGYTRHEGMVRLSPGRTLDLGGIGKGAAADLALQACLEAGAANLELPALGAPAGEKTGNSGGKPPQVSGAVPRVMVNLGSSSLALQARSEEPWRIGIRSPWAGAPNPVGYLELSTGSVSFSGTARELEPCPDWDTHLMNPLTGQPAKSDVALAVVVVPPTVTSPGCAAEALSTAIVLAGSQAGLDICTEHGVQAVVFTCDRQILGTPGMIQILRLTPSETTQPSAMRSETEG